MGVTNRQLILDDLNTVLTALVGDETALVPLGKVERCLRAWDDPQINPLPWVGCCSTRQVFTHEPFEHMVSAMEVDVWGHVAVPAGDDLEDRVASASDLEDMLIAAVMADPGRGGYAISTTLKDSFSDEGHPDYADAGMNIFTTTLRFEVKYLRTTALTEADPVPPGPEPDLDIGIGLMLPLGGQSNALTSGSGSALTTTQPFSNVRWDRGTAALIPLVETTAESPASAIANWVTEQEQSPPPGRVCAIDNWAVGSTAYAQLKKGTANYANAQTAMQSAIAAMDEGAICGALMWIHGETDEINSIARDAYAAQMIELQSDWQGDTQALLGVDYEVPLILTQYAQWPHLGSGSKLRPAVALGQLDAGFEENIYCVGPTYHLTFDAAGQIHTDEEGKRRCGEYIGKVVRHVVVEGDPWLPLYMAEATAVDNEVRVRLEGGDGSALVIDTTNMRARHDAGFEYTDDSGAPAHITGVAIDGPEVVLTLDRSAQAGALVRYGMTTGRLATLGPTGVGTGGNIRDSDPTTSRVGDPTLWNWLCVGELAAATVTPGATTAPAWTDDQSLRITGSAMGARVNEWSGLDGATSATISFWVRIDSAPGSSVSLFEKSLVGQRQFGVRLTAARALQIFAASNASTIVSGTTTSAVIGTAAWHHVIIRLDLSNGTNASRVDVMVNGVSVGWASTPTWPTSLPSGITCSLGLGDGSNPLGVARSINLRDPNVYSNVRATDPQAAELYGGGVCVDPATTSLGAPDHHWPLSGSFADIQGSAHARGFSGVGFQAEAP